MALVGFGFDRRGGVVYGVYRGMAICREGCLKRGVVNRKCCTP
jgi:hypothetical protein